MFYTYLLQSIKDNKWYTGCTDDLRARFKRHNKGNVLSTKGRGPFKIIYYEACENSKDAYSREKYLKTGMGKRFLKNRLKRALALTGLTLILCTAVVFNTSHASAATNVYYSVGQNTSDHKTGSPTVTISNGIATFSTPQTARNMGVGDKVTYTSGSAFISAKITTSKWRIITATGTTPTNITSPETVSSIAHAFASLHNAVDSGHLGITDATHLNNTDLTVANAIINVPLYYDTGPDTTAVTISGITTGANNYLRIYTPTNTSTEVNQSQRHNGKWSSKRFNITTAISNYESNVRLEGLQMSYTAIAYANAGITGGDLQISGCIIKDSMIRADSGNTPNLKIWNNIMYGYTGTDGAMYIYSNTAYIYNNTLYNSRGRGIRQISGTVVVKNNIVVGSGNSYAFYAMTSFDASSSNNATDGTDVTIADTRTSQNFKFVNEKAKDFHLLSIDTGTRGYGANLSNDANLPFSTDIDGQHRPSTSSGQTAGAVWDIGADQTQEQTKVISRPQSPTPTTPAGVTNVYYSVGQNTSDHKTGSPTVTISNGIATFSTPQTARNMGVGDKVTYTSGSAFISAKITTSKWRVITATGATPTNVTSPETVTSIAHAFASLNAAVGGGSPGAAGVNYLTTADLTISSYILNIPLYYDTGPDKTAVIIQAFTTSAANYLRIYAPTNTSTEVNQSQRHNGKWDNGKWRMVLDGVSNGSILISAVNYIRIDGLQFKMSHTSGYGHGVNWQTIAANNAIYISNNIFWGEFGGEGTYTGNAIYSNDVDTVSYIWNNVVYGWINGAATIYAMSFGNSTNNYIYNNTLINNSYGIRASITTANVTFKNNLIKGSGANTYTGLFTSDSSNNSTDSTDVIGAGTNNLTSQTFKFVSTKRGQEDFHLLSSDTGARGSGANLSNDANLPFSTDIDGQKRPAASAGSSGAPQWDIGADQTQEQTKVISRPNSAPAATPAGVTNVYYSVGQNTSDHKTGSPTVTISNGIATFSTPQTARNMGVGDKVTYTSGSAFISAKITTSKWRLITATGGTPTNVTSPETVSSIAHAFASLFAAEAGIPASLGTSDLTAATGGNYVLNIPLYYDTGPDTTAVVILGWTTAAANYIRIYTPTNTSTEVNQSQRHSGKWDNTKWRMEVTTQINIDDNEDYVRIDGLQTKTIFDSSNPCAVVIRALTSGNNKTEISNSIFKGVMSGAAAPRGIYNINANNNLYFWNNIMTDWTVGGYAMRVVGVGYIYNNTFYNNVAGILVDTADAVIAKNNIVIGSGNTNAYLGTFNSGSDYNSTDGTDSTDGGANSRRSQTFKFVNAKAGDFHLLSTDTGARGYGTNLSDDANLPFSTDIDGQARPKNGPWDIGADQKPKTMRITN